jgi:hypothetical protein
MEPTLGQADWRKSSYSGGTGNCVEVAGNLPGIVAVRDSWDPDGPALILTPAAWRALTLKARNGELDLPAALSALPQAASLTAPIRIPLEDANQGQPGDCAGIAAKTSGGARVHDRKQGACPLAGAHALALGRLRLRLC